MNDHNPNKYEGSTESQMIPKWLTDCPFGPRGPVAPCGPGGPRGPGNPGAPAIPEAPYKGEKQTKISEQSKTVGCLQNHEFRERSYSRSFSSRNTISTRVTLQRQRRTSPQSKNGSMRVCCLWSKSIVCPIGLILNKPMLRRVQGILGYRPLREDPVLLQIHGLQ